MITNVPCFITFKFVFFSHRGFTQVMEYKVSAHETNKETMVTSTIVFETPKRFSVGRGYTVPLLHNIGSKSTNESMIFAPFFSSFKYPFNQYKSNPAAKFQSTVILGEGAIFLHTLKTYFQNMFESFMSSAARSSIMPGEIEAVRNSFRFDSPLITTDTGNELTMTNNHLPSKRGVVPNVLIADQNRNSVPYHSSLFTEEHENRMFGFTFSCNWLSITIEESNIQPSFNEILRPPVFIVRPKCSMFLLILQPSTDKPRVPQQTAMERRAALLDQIMTGPLTSTTADPRTAKRINPEPLPRSYSPPRSFSIEEGDHMQKKSRGDDDHLPERTHDSAYYYRGAQYDN